MNPRRTHQQTPSATPRNVLAANSRPVLFDFALSNVLLAFDFDGTLAPLANRPEGVRMRPRTRRLLGSLAVRYPLVIISGRSWIDLTKRVGPIPIWHLAGNHGLEPWDARAAYQRRVRGWIAQLTRSLKGLGGVEIEDKTYSLTVHYRRARPKRRAQLALSRAVRRLRGARVIGGRDAVSVLPSRALHKGNAVDRARSLLACDRVIYVGDDETDEDAFSSAVADRLLGIRVGRKLASAARYYVTTQTQVDTLLRLLLSLRPITRSRL